MAISTDLQSGTECDKLSAVGKKRLDFGLFEMVGADRIWQQNGNNHQKTAEKLRL